MKRTFWTLRIVAVVTAGVFAARLASAASYTWNWTNGVGLDMNWSDATNWAPNGVPGAGDAVTFNLTNSGSGSALFIPGGGQAQINVFNVNNVVDNNFGGTISSLTYTNINGTYQNTYITNAGVLNVTGTNGLVVGQGGPGGTNVYGVTTEFVTISGTNATLNVNNTNANIWVTLGDSGLNGGEMATLDLSGLGHFNATISRLLIGLQGSSGLQGANRPGGTLYLAATNVITAVAQAGNIGTTDSAYPAVDIGDAGSNSGGLVNTLYLGQTNLISADTIVVGRQKGLAALLFNPNLANTLPAPVATFQGFSSSAVSIFSVGDGAANTGTLNTGGLLHFNGVVDFTGGIINLSATTLNVGRGGDTTSGSGSLTYGMLTFDNGTITAGTLNIGIQTAANSAKTGLGVVNVSSNSTTLGTGTLMVSGAINIGTTISSAIDPATAGTLNITNGTVMAGSIVPGSGSTTAINVNGGTLVVSNTIGIAGAPVGTLSLTPLGFPGNSSTILQIGAGTIPTTANVQAGNLTIDGFSTTTNVINVSSLSSIGHYPVELSLIAYRSFNNNGGTFNIGLGTLPASTGVPFAGYITNDVSSNTIAVVLTAGPAATVPLSVTITSPTAGATFFAPATFTITASTSDPGATVTNVQFLVNGALLGNATNAPYSATASGLTNGSYTLSAVASDNAGATATNSISITVLIPPPPSATWNWTNFVSIDMNWSDPTNWTPVGLPSPTVYAIFNTTNAVSTSGLFSPGGGQSQINVFGVNNVVDANFGGTVASLVYSNLSGTYQNTYITNAGVLNVTGTNGLIVGNGTGSGTGSVDYGVTTEFVTISGTNATLNVNNTNANVWVTLGSASSAAMATLDLSALGYFNAAIRKLMVGVPAIDRPGGALYLAATNNITAEFQTTATETSGTVGTGAISIGDTTSNSGKQNNGVYLGQRNTITADTIVIGRQKAQGQMVFNPAFTNGASLAVANFQGFSANALSVVSIGDGVANSGTTSCTGLADFTGGTVNLPVSTLYIGRGGSNTSSTAATSTGTLTFDGGVITVGTLDVGLQPAVSPKSGVGTVNVNSNSTALSNGTLVVTGAINLAMTTGGTGGATGTLNINNGTVLANQVNAGASNSTSAINLNGGTLILSSAVGSAAAPLGTLALTPTGMPGDTKSVLQMVGGATAGAAGVIVSNLIIDGSSVTTNIINVTALPPIPHFPAEVPLITYSNFNTGGGIFNIGLGTLPLSGIPYAAYLTNDVASNSIALVVTAGPPPAATVTNISFSGTSLAISGTGGAQGGTYFLLTSTNVVLALSHWTVMATNSFDSSGNFNLTVPYSATNQAQFFVIAAP